MIPSISLAEADLDQDLALSIHDELRDRLLDGATALSEMAKLGEAVLRDRLGPAARNAAADFTAGSVDALLIKGFRVDERVPTPATGFADESELALTNAVHLGLLELLEVETFSVPYENRGELIRNVTFVPEAAGKTKLWGADTEFFWHTDNPNWAFVAPPGRDHEAIPTFLAFCAIRNTEKAATELVSAKHVLSGLSASTIAALERPEFVFAPPASNKNFDTRSVLPLVERRGAQVWVRFDQGITSATTPRAREALDELVTRLKAVDGARLVLEPGDFMIFDNRRVFHLRRSFTPLSQGASRWLRRCYGIERTT